MVTAPVSTGTIITPAPGTAVPTPMPRPGATPAAGVLIPAGGVVTSGYTPVTTAGYTVMTEPAPARRGLFARFRTRGTTVAAPMPMTVVAPAPMPMPMTTVVPASGTTIVPTTVVPMTTTSDVVMTTGTTAPRMGLLARLRARMGR